jgi:probable rRNA maturation factor
MVSYGYMAKTVIEVRKNPNENNSSVLRRFSRRIQESGIIRKVKGARYNVRKESKLKIKKSALKRMARRKEIEKLKKLGKMRFDKLKNEILGKKYDLSIVFVNEKKSKEINKKYRNKNKATNILSFPLRKNMGEIILCPVVIKKEAKNFNKNFSEFLDFLVIHGMLHLDGMEHGSRMEEREKIYDQKYFGGHRRGVVQDASRGRRIYKRRKKS